MLTSTTVHEDGGVGKWTFIDTLYFGIVTITTTGYGDLLPTDNIAKLYSMFNCYFGVVIISSVMGFMVAGVMEKKATAMVDEMQGKLEEEGDQLTGGLISKVCDLIPIPRHVSIAFGLMIIFKFIGILYYTHADQHPLHHGLEDGAFLNSASPWHASNYTDRNSTAPGYCNVACPNDELSLTTDGGGHAAYTNCPDCLVMYDRDTHFDDMTMSDPFCDKGHMYYHNDLLTASYMVSVTMTSVGYGDFSPQGEGARCFAIFWILIATLLNVNAWGSLASWSLECYQEILDSKKTEKVFDAKSIMQIDKDSGGEVDEMEFVTHMLVKTNKCDLMTLADIRRQFAELDASGDGVITKEDIDMHEKKEKERIDAESAAKSKGPKSPKSLELDAPASPNSNVITLAPLVV